MAKHEVKFTIPERPLGKADVSFVIKQDGSTLGTLAISNGSVVWFPKGNTYGFKMGWVELDKLMQAKATRVEKR